MSWDGTSVRLMEIASRRTDFYRETARWIARRLPPGAHVCDAGCGLGFLSLELAPYAGRVTAVDRSELALDVLRRECAARGAGNIDAVCADVEAMRAQYDAMVFCLFAECEQGLRIARRQCRGDVFMALRAPGAHCRGRRGLHETLALLDALGVPYQAQERTISFDQPLESMEQALAHAARCGMTREELERRLVKTPGEAYPLCLPHERHMGFVHFCAADIPPV